MGGKSASLACPRTLARTVELWGVRADVWEGVWRGLGGFGDSGGSGMSQNPSKDCGDVGSEQLCFGDLLVALKRSRGCGTVGGPSGGLEQQPPTNSTSRLQHTAGQASGGVGSEQELDLGKEKIFIFGSFWNHPGFRALAGPRRSVGLATLARVWSSGSGFSG